MSGQLVGEVLDAAGVLQARGLSERGFHALVAIAEKCHHITRQGSVPWKHIRAGLYGASKRTAERAVEDLKRVGVLCVVKPGFNNNHGRICAPIYEIQPLTDTDTQVTQSPQTDTDTQVTQSPQTDTDKTGDRYRQNGDRYRHPGDVLNGSINGPTDGGARANAAPSSPPEISDDKTRASTRPRCERHAHILRDADVPGCVRCQKVREDAEAREAQEEQHRQAIRRAIRKAIDDCADCDVYGRLDIGGNCPKHTNFRQHPEFAPRKQEGAA